MAEGAEGEPAKGSSEGLEQVRGYKRPEGTPDQLWAPPTAELRDIGEASFGPLPPHAETVHGPDDRVQITDTAVYPWRVHCSLLITAATTPFGSAPVGSSARTPSPPRDTSSSSRTAASRP
ncbi:hypothetical protein [Streptomyces sp. H27-D2]|uniref:hypothetical protein n=1 Tax=Streptomyces sp. H27-D2 TaxID=3046304 RepID=UPI002DBE6EAA|nr:hypothetical protein [Streptomyces sp. H27-D2]MEC4017200.1 hypothetical protein [Streptomyces sp. H27-D2]